MKELYTIDFSILDGIQKYLSCGFLDWLMPKITVLGNAGIIWIILAFILLCTKKYRILGMQLATSLMGCLILVNAVLKNLIARPRPCWINQSISLLIANPKDYSFPSGHSFAAFATAFVLWKANKKVGVIAYIFSAMIAFSRLYLYVHFPSDVLAGILLGTIVGYLTTRLIKLESK